MSDTSHAFCIYNPINLEGQGERTDAMYNFQEFFNYWNTLIKDWHVAPDKEIRKNVYLSKFSNPTSSPLYQGYVGHKLIDFYKYRPEPYLGDPENCCAVMLNLNPGFGIPPSVEEYTHPDYKLQHCEAKDKIHYDAKGFVPYLSGQFVADPKECVKTRDDIPSGVFWWNGSYNKKLQTCTGGRIDYIHHLYNLYFGKTPNNLPFVLEVCPWRSYNFKLTHIFPEGIPENNNDKLVDVIDKYVITPALQATKGKSTLPFVICIGSAVKNLAKILNLETKPEWCWNGNKGIVQWPTHGNGQSIERTYTLYRRDDCYLLNIYAPGSNKPPGKGTFQKEIEPRIIENIKSIINHNFLK